MRSTGVRAGAMDVIPETPLSHEELNRAVVRLALLSPNAKFEPQSYCRTGLQPFQN